MTNLGARDDELPIVGREETIRQVLESSCSVIVIAGDSGVGKTTVLDEVRTKLVNETVAPPVRRSRMFPGSLQVALLESLGWAVADIARERSSIEKVTEAFARAAQAVATSRLRDMAGAVFSHLIGVVRGQLGDLAADALKETVVQLSSSREEQLSVRISHEADADVVKVICAIAADVAELAAEERIVVCLDDVDRLGESDQRLLCDLVEELPAQVQVVATLMTADAKGRDASDRLQEQGAEVVVLSGLSESDVARLLTHRGHPPELAATVRRVTGGYGMYLADALSLLADADGRPGVLADLEPSDVLRNGTRRAWRFLDSESQRAAALLVPFSQPVPRDDRAGYLGLEPTVWEAIEARLLDTGIFDEAEDVWFHELRRRSIWHDFLTDAQRSRAVGRGLEYVHHQLDSREASPRLLMEYARLLRVAPEPRPDPKVAAALDASPHEIAVAGALIELAEPERGDPGAIADHVLTHARQAFNATGALVDALHQLSDRELVHTASNEHVTAVVPIWGSVETIWVIGGRAATEFGRTPVPSAATGLFETVLREKLGSFEQAIYGVGSPSIAELSKRAQEFQRHRPDGTVHLGRKGPNLLIRGRHGELPLYSAVAYNEPKARNEAAEDLQGVQVEVLGIELQLEQVLKHPLTAVPSLRFARALDRLYGTRTSWAHRSSLSRDFDEPLQIQEEAQRRVATVAAIRELCSPLERFAYQLEDPVGILFAEQDDHSFVARVLGSDSARHLKMAGPLTGSMLRSRVAQQAELTRTESLGRLTTRSGPRRTDPILDEVNSLIRTAREFNKYQPRREIILSHEDLARAVSEASERELGDARALSESLTFLDVDESALRGQTLFMLLQLDDPKPGFVPGAHAQVFTTQIPNDSDHDEVQLKIAKPNQTAASPGSLAGPLHREFGLTEDALMSHGAALGGARHTIARLLGHSEDEISLSYDSHATASR